MGKTGDASRSVLLANYEDLRGVVLTFGAKYNPPSDVLKVEKLAAHGLDAAKAISNVVTCENALRVLSGERNAVYESVSPLATRVVNMVDVCCPDTRLVDAAKAISRKIHGSKLTKPEKEVTAPPADPKKKIVTSQRSYELVTSNYGNLVTMTEGMPAYTANEEDLKVANLRALHTKLFNLNREVAIAEGKLAAARSERDALLYDNADSLCNLIRDIKQYVKAAFGSSSAEYNLVRRFTFKNISD